MTYSNLFQPSFKGHLSMLALHPPPVLLLAAWASSPHHSFACPSWPWEGSPSKLVAVCKDCSCSSTSPPSSCTASVTILPSFLLVCMDSTPSYTPCLFVCHPSQSHSFHPEGGGSMVLHNAGILPHDYMASQHMNTVWPWELLLVMFIVVTCLIPLFKLYFSFAHVC